jgi:hypothetical protein
MRALNLHEKIGLKGLLVTRGVPVSELAKTNEIRTFSSYYWQVAGRPITMWNTQKMWRKAPRRHNWKSK